MIEYYSHPNILLINHLRSVGILSKKVIKSKRLYFGSINSDAIADTAYLIGISHDFGKFTTFFQDKLNGILLTNKERANHSILSAFFTYELLQEYFELNRQSDNNVLSLIPGIGFLVTKHHHGDLNNVDDDIDPQKLYKHFLYFNDQLDDIFDHIDAVEGIYSKLLQDFDISTKAIFNRIKKYKRKINYSGEIKKIIKPVRLIIKNLRNGSDFLSYALINFHFSVLIDSDKKHTGNVRKINRRSIPGNLVEHYLNIPEFKEKRKNPINIIRDRIRKSVLKNINVDSHIFTITAPTGTGKTFTSFSTALKLRKLIAKKNDSLEPRIIYSLPFTSIIDQNFEVYNKILNQMDDFKENQSEYLLKHHHLSDVFYKSKSEKQEIPVDESLALIESWESEIIVTTFVQLFHTLIGYKNRSLKKFHNIANSIIILDEVQNIPIEYWKLVQKVLRMMAKYFNCYIILMTATKPLIFTKDDNFNELVDDYKNYFQAPDLNRVTLKVTPEKTLDEFVNELPKFTQKKYLFVFNTIDSSLDFYNRIKSKVSNYELFYLSTNILPIHRTEKINQIKKALLNNENTIIVSTQLIEAGVDIDCEVVYRDIGPLDSIIQVAGRCNRENSQDKKGVVSIQSLKKDETSNLRFANIYDSTAINITESLLKKEKYLESEFIQLINEYFSIAKRKSQESNLFHSITKLYYYGDNSDVPKPISSFELIKENYYKSDVFIEFDKTAKDVWEKYSKIQKLEPLKRKIEFLGIRKNFNNFIVSIPKSCFNELPEGIYYLRHDRISQHYNDTTGFKLDSELPPEQSSTFF